MTLVADLQAAVDAALVEDPPFSGVVLIRQGGETILERTLGFAQHAEQIPNRVDTRFGTASGCKIFTAIAVQQLIEQGRFALATPLCELLHIPYALDPAITVRHLLTHSSGLPDYYDEEVLSEQDCLDLMAEHAVYTLVSPQDYLPLFLDRPAKFPVGERFHYNNGAFVLLALLVEQQSGRSFPDYISEQIFERAGMGDSGYFRMDELPARTSYGYIRQPDGTHRSNFFTLPTIGSGDGGAFVSATDWGKFWDALHDHWLLGEAMTRSMLQPHIATGERTANRHYGYGVWLLVRDGAVHTHYVEGGDFGVGMFSGTFPRTNVQLTVLDNHGDCSGRVWNRVRQALP